MARQGRCTAFFKAVLAHNASITCTPLHVAVRGAWSPSGTMTYWAEWRVTLAGVDGDVFEGTVVTIADIRRWKTRHLGAPVPKRRTHGLRPRHLGAPVPKRRAWRQPDTGRARGLR